MGREQIEALYEKALRCAKINGHSSLAEDFAGWITVKWLEGKAQHQLLDHSLIDFLRLEYGSAGGRCGTDALLRARRQQEATVPGRDESTAEDALERMHASSGNAQGSMDEPSSAPRLSIDPRGYLPIRLAEAWAIVAKDELDHGEAGQLLGVCESRVSQLIGAAKREVLRFEGLRLMKERIEDGRSKLEIEWITL